MSSLDSRRDPSMRTPLLDPLAPDERLSADDMASRREEEDPAAALAAQALRAGGGALIVRGFCIWCGACCPPLAVYCSPLLFKCRSEHEADLARQARLARPPRC
jgi:hypothetical protein